MPIQSQYDLPDLECRELNVYIVFGSAFVSRDTRSLDIHDQKGPRSISNHNLGRLQNNRRHNKMDARKEGKGDLIRR